MAGNMAPVPEYRVREWLSAFEADALLATRFPVQLANGDKVPGLHVVCSRCGQRLPAAMVRGKVMQSLPHVLTVEANGLCEPCDRLTHVDCRFRSGADGTVIEWLGSDGRWLARECRQPTLMERIVTGTRKWAGRFAAAR